MTIAQTEMIDGDPFVRLLGIDPETLNRGVLHITLHNDTVPGPNGTEVLVGQSVSGKVIIDRENEHTEIVYPRVSIPYR